MLCSSVPGFGNGVPALEISIACSITWGAPPFCERHSTSTATMFPLHDDVSHAAAFSPLKKPPTIAACELSTSASFWSVTSAAVTMGALTISANDQMRIELRMTFPRPFRRSYQNLLPVDAL